MLVLVSIMLTSTFNMLYNFLGLWNIFALDHVILSWRGVSRSISSMKIGVASLKDLLVSLNWLWSRVGLGASWNVSPRSAADVICTSWRVGYAWCRDVADHSRCTCCSCVSAISNRRAWCIDSRSARVWLGTYDWMLITVCNNTSTRILWYSLSSASGVGKKVAERVAAYKKRGDSPRQAW